MFINFIYEHNDSDWSNRNFYNHHICVIILTTYESCNKCIASKHIELEIKFQQTLIFKGNWIKLAKASLKFEIQVR